MLALHFVADADRHLTLWLVTEAEKRVARRVRAKVAVDLNAEEQMLAVQVLSAWTQEPLNLRRASALLDAEPPPEGNNTLVTQGAVLRVLPKSEALTVNLRPHQPSEVAEQRKIEDGELLLDGEDRLVGLMIPTRPTLNAARAVLGLGSQMA